MNHRKSLIEKTDGTARIFVDSLQMNHTKSAMEPADVTLEGRSEGVN